MFEDVAFQSTDVSSKQKKQISLFNEYTQGSVSTLVLLWGHVQSNNEVQSSWLVYILIIHPLNENCY